ncbi:MAG: MBL fold metallo-hydrolase [Betaproteobacteria bacterium]|nr:MBL fold metallo-hydrolase [Betaproteobacteria bacterium]
MKTTTRLATVLTLTSLISATSAAQAAEQFDNVYPFPPKSFWTAMRWRWNRTPAVWPTSRPLKQSPRVGQVLKNQQAAITWIGHSSFLVEFEDLRILMDPIYSEKIFPGGFLGPKRVVEPGVSLEKTPKVDLILLSHDHFDHMDLPTLEYFAKRDNPVVVAGKGNKPLLEDTGFKNVIELNWWEKHNFNNSVEITFVPAQHWSTRSLISRNTTLWGGYYFKVKEKTYYFVGDTGYHPKLFKEIQQRVGSPDFAFIPIGAYAQRDFMKDQHNNPEEAVAIHLDVKSKTSVGMHFGTFQLSDEPIDEPCELLRTETKIKSLPSSEFTCMEQGETRFLFTEELRAEK